MSKIVEFPDKNAIEEQAASWLVRMDADDPMTTVERRKLQEWLRRSPGHREELLRLARLWNQMNLLTELAVPLDAARSERQGGLMFLSRPAVWTSLAAILVTGIVVGMMLLAGSSSPNKTNGLYATAVGQQMPISLQDGSVVLLNTDSQVRVAYSEQFRDVVLLQGEAHFTVAPNTTREFRVTAGHGRIRAVGTAFSVYLRDDSIDVTVTEGTVSLAAVRSQAEPVNDGSAIAALPLPQTTIRELGTLSAGEVATISSRTNDQFETIDVLDNVTSIAQPSMSRRLSWTEGVLYFSGEPLDEVVREISRYTTVNIEFADDEVSAIRIGGRFPVGETDAMLETLENTFGLHVERLSDRHVLVSAGEL